MPAGCGVEVLPWSGQRLWAPGPPVLPLLTHFMPKGSTTEVRQAMRMGRAGQASGGEVGHEAGWALVLILPSVQCSSVKSLS